MKGDFEMLRLFQVLFLLFILSVQPSVADDMGRIYGKITTTRGDILEGFIRWDKNEGSWVDILNGSKDIFNRNSRSDRNTGRRRYARDRKKIRLFGYDISGDRFRSAQSGIRFGHIAKMKVMGDDRVRLTLKSGEEVEFFNGSTDIGTGIREIVIEDKSEGELELVWDDIDLIEFSQAPSNIESVFGERLYGTLTTRHGEEYTGFVCWDMDELFMTDVLDGEERGRTRKIRFGRISSIERYSSKGASVNLQSGDELILKGTNDVDDGNRGILILDDNLGQVQVSWSEFDKLVITPSPYSVLYNSFDGGRPLSGKVITEDGEEFVGLIRWDNDEEYGWEILDGASGRIEFDIEFSLISAIEKNSRGRGSLITLKDGRTMRLSGSNDVDEDNKGIYIILADGEEIRVDWYDFARVEFSN